MDSSDVQAWQKYAISRIDSKRALHRFLPCTLHFSPLIAFSLLIQLFYSKYILKMSSMLEPDSSFTPSALAESTTTTQSYSKKWRSPVWAYCRRPTKDENQDFLYCSHCSLDSTLLPYGTTLSENMKRHLERHH
jgi:hypothetical protein